MENQESKHIIEPKLNGIKIIVIYLIIFLIVMTGGLVIINSAWLSNYLIHFKNIFNCCLIGGVGGILYSLRAVYLNFSWKNQWSKEWEIWYYLRPITSTISGGISFLIIKAGLLVLEANSNTDSSYFGIYVLAFVAGLNVDVFISKIEDLAKSTWNIDKSRASENFDGPPDRNNTREH